MKAKAGETVRLAYQGGRQMQSIGAVDEMLRRRRVQSPRFLGYDFAFWIACEVGHFYRRDACLLFSLLC